MSPFDYVAMYKRSNEIRRLYRIPKEQGTGFHWTSAMEGGPVVTDAEHWHRLYNELAKECAEARDVITSLNRKILRLEGIIHNAGIATDVEKRKV